MARMQISGSQVFIGRNMKLSGVEFFRCLVIFESYGVIHNEHEIPDLIGAADLENCAFIECNINTSQAYANHVFRQLVSRLKK